MAKSRAVNLLNPTPSALLVSRLGIPKMFGGGNETALKGFPNKGIKGELLVKSMALINLLNPGVGNQTVVGIPA